MRVKELIKTLVNCVNGDFDMEIEIREGPGYEQLEIVGVETDYLKKKVTIYSDCGTF